MDFNQWVFIERFINTALPVILVSGLIVFTIGALLLGPRYKERRRWGIGMMVISAVGLAAAVIFMFTPSTRHYMKEFSHVTPRVRVERPSFFGYTPESERIVGAYSVVQNDQDMKQLTMYSRQPVRETVRLVGYADGSYYFYVGQNVTPVNYSGPVTKKQVTAPYLTGYRYTLNDRRYRQIGFITPDRYSTLALVVPTNWKAKTPSNDVLENAKRLVRLGTKWTTEETTN